MSKVVYLMGAGASYGKRERSATGKVIAGKILDGLPIVSEIPFRLKNTIELYSKTKYGENELYEKNQRKIKLKDAQKTLIADLNWLYDNTIKHATIDTFAKKLFLTGKENEYVKLKRLLSLYFKTEQMINRPDSRYDTFLASVLQRNSRGKLRISEDISILTWNYDSQFEIAYREYLLNDEHANDLQYPELLGIDIHSDYTKFPKPSTFHDDGTRQIFKLNGSAAFYSEYSMGFYYSYDKGSLSEDQIKINLWTYFAPYYIDTLERKECLLNFAWEHDSTSSQYIKSLESHISDAETLVVIGYTFPFFNRNVDSVLFKYLCRSLKNIYIQDPNAINIKESVMNIIQKSGNSFHEDKIRLKNDVSQFFMPPEL